MTLATPVTATRTRETKASDDEHQNATRRDDVETTPSLATPTMPTPPHDFENSED